MRELFLGYVELGYSYSLTPAKPPTTNQQPVTQQPTLGLRGGLWPDLLMCNP
jgi:hypothetical protein